MWCRTCQQDVPGVASSDEATVRCARCHAVMAFRAGSGSPETDIAAALTGDVAGQRVTRAASPPVLGSGSLLEDWELDEDLRAADQLLRSLDPAAAPLPDATSVPPDQRTRGGAAGPSRYRAGDSRHRSVHRGSGLSAFLSWTLLSLGLMTFVFGGVLLGWSLLAERPDLWQLGIPFALAGQAALILGLVFQLDGLWRSNRASADTLGELDEQLSELRHATTLLTTAHSQPAQSFYLHMAEGASPHLLLADLKGQLDLLTMKLSQKT